ncbi:hypothetical protein [Algisphaera agarilytica]|uniref:Uncharacterized protein n=1 Tax=Algisphaera agarilytica TaxID=1385975 RepID=A0A7X0H588_9BACT|nr:hypothetical protein [Algisphaera agarilytica]MBB6429470.1 hypothetical protein [Algisphaera agarilytica]
MRKMGLSWGTMCVAVLGLQLVGCGDGGEAEPTAEANDAVVETLTPEEAEALAKFRAEQAGEQDPSDKTAESQSKPKPDAKAQAKSDKVEIDTNAPFPEIGQKPQAQAKPTSGSPAASAPASNANTPTVFRKHQVTDPGLNGMVAKTILVPEDWKIEGGITRGSNMMWNNPFFHDVMYSAPDGRQLHFFPSLAFEFSAQAMQQGAQLFQPINGNLFYPLPETPGSWLMELAKNNPDPDVSNLRLISEEPEPEFAKLLQQQSALMYQSAQQLSETGAQLGMGAAFDTQATVVKIQYVENGIELEESVLIAWQYFVNFSQGQLTSGTWAVPLMISMRGPVGTDYMKDPELMTVMQSMRINPQWQAEMNRYWQQLAKIRADGQAQRNRDWQAHNAKMQQYREDTNAIIAGGYATRSAIRDAGDAKTIDSIREVTPYEIGGQTVKIPDYYDNVHTDGTGRYILSNDFNYNPNRDLNLSGNWTKVDPQR